MRRQTSQNNQMSCENMGEIVECIYHIVKLIHNTYEK